MRVPVLKTEAPIVKIVVVHPDATEQSALVQSGVCANYYFTLPSGVSPKQCYVYSQLCDYNGQPYAKEAPVVHWGAPPVIAEPDATQGL
jgi:hypothetical protein